MNKMQLLWSFIIFYQNIQRKRDLPNIKKSLKLLKNHKRWNKDINNQFQIII